MKIHFLGTCCGAEPIPGRRHASVAVESKERIYFFDAGESCAYTAHLMGLDLLKVKKIIISHPHMDHVGGLGNLLWHIGKIASNKKTVPLYGAIEVYTPSMDIWQGTMLVLRNQAVRCEDYISAFATQVEAGVLFDDGIMKVTAIPNTHLKHIMSSKCLSFSYLIECEGKRLIYSGDVGRYEELDEVLSAGCDGLIIETGHFTFEQACNYCKTKEIGRIFFSHNGRSILNDLAYAQERVKTLLGDKAVICEDGMSIIL